MDPTKIACKIYNSFKEHKPTYDSKMLPIPYINDSPQKLISKIKKKNVHSSRFTPVYCDIATYRKLGEVSSQVFALDSEDVYNEAAEIADPFSRIGNSVFGRNNEVARNSLKMANIDAIYKFTGHYSSLLKMRLDTTYTYVGKTSSEAYTNPVGLFKEDRDFIACIIQDMGWSATNYLQFRLKNVRIHSMNTLSQNKGFTTPSTKYFVPTYGEDGTGNIVSNWRFLVKLIRSRNLEGINLCIANGIVSDSKSEHLFVVSEVLTGLKVCGRNATFILRLQDTLTQFYAELLYTLAQCFNAIVLFKPVTCEPESEEKYLICLERREDSVVGTYTKLLEEVLDSVSRDSVLSFLKEDLPEDFKIWLSQSNTINLEDEIKAFERIRKVIQGEDLGIEYNEERALKVLSVPGNIPQNKII